MKENQIKFDCMSERRLQNKSLNIPQHKNSYLSEEKCLQDNANHSLNIPKHFQVSNQTEKLQCEKKEIEVCQIVSRKPSEYLNNTEFTEQVNSNTNVIDKTIIENLMLKEKVEEFQRVIRQYEKQFLKLEKIIKREEETNSNSLLSLEQFFEQFSLAKIKIKNNCQNYAFKSENSIFSPQNQLQKDLENQDKNYQIVNDQQQSLIKSLLNSQQQINYLITPVLKQIKEFDQKEQSKGIQNTNSTQLQPDQVFNQQNLQKPEFNIDDYKIQLTELAQKLNQQLQTQSDKSISLIEAKFESLEINLKYCTELLTKNNIEQSKTIIKNFEIQNKNVHEGFNNIYKQFFQHLMMSQLNSSSSYQNLQTKIKDFELKLQKSKEKADLQIDQLKAISGNSYQEYSTEMVKITEELQENSLQFAKNIGLIFQKVINETITQKTQQKITPTPTPARNSSFLFCFRR